MGIFSRVRDIVSSNLNAMLDKAEDPEKLVRLMIREMEDTLVELKASCAAAMANCKKVQRALDEATKRADDWSAKAELAVDKGREDLAREALLERRRYRERAASFEEEQSECAGIVDNYQKDIAQLEEKLAGVRDKQRLLVQRHNQAQHKKRAQGNIRKVDTSDALLRFEQFEQRVDRMEAEASLVNFARKTTLETEFSSLETDDELEQELKALKDARQGS